MKLSILLAAGTILGGLTVANSPASAINACAGSGFSACDLTFTFNSDGSVTTSGPGGSSIGGEDALIGVINNSGSTLFSFNLDGGSIGIFGFDADGIDTYGTMTGPNALNPDTTTYGGPDGYFTNIVGNTGTVNFTPGIADGGSDYFSLEEAISLSAPPTATTTVPEPVSMSLLATALFGLGAARARRRA